MSEISAFAVYNKSKSDAAKKKRKRKAKRNKVENSSSNEEKITNVELEQKNETKNPNDCNLTNGRNVEDFGSDSDEIPELVPVDDEWESSFFDDSEVISASTTSEEKTNKKKKLRNAKQIKKKSENSIDSDACDTKRKKQNIIVKKHINFDEKAKEFFEWLIEPVSASDFFEQYWEKKPLYIKRTDNIYKHILTTKDLDTILRENSLFFTKNVDVVQYVDGKKENYNIEGRAYASNLWSFYNEGRSIRILNPHTYNEKIHQILSAFQEYFGTMAGANVYLTPPGSQGFAPHYDDIEAFVIQLEGRKNWKLYAPRNSSDVLPRFSSENFKGEDLKGPEKEVTLEPGDLLYFPRGIIHEGYTDSDSHSLHVTISVYQRTSYADLLEHGLCAAIKIATEEDPIFRKGLPVNYLKHVGVVNSDKISDTRETIIKTVNYLMNKLPKYMPIDAAADQLGKKFMWDALPPVLSEDEKKCMIHENGEKIRNGIVKNQIEIDLDVKIRLIRYHSLRLVLEEDTKFRVYYSVENAKVYHEEEQQYFEIDESLAPAVEHLIVNYPFFVKVSLLPLENDETKVEFATIFWERGLLLTEKPLLSQEK